MPVVTEESPPPQRRRGRYSKQFRKDAAALVRDQQRSVADVARELGVVEQTLGNWVRQERIAWGQKGGHDHRGPRGECQASPGGEAPDDGA